MDPYSTLLYECLSVAVCTRALHQFLPYYTCICKRTNWQVNMSEIGALYDFSIVQHNRTRSNYTCTCSYTVANQNAVKSSLWVTNMALYFKHSTWIWEKLIKHGSRPKFQDIMITNLFQSYELYTLRDIVSYAVICRVCPRHGMQIHIQTCTCADQYTYSYLDMSMSSAVCRWVLLGLRIGCVPHPYREWHSVNYDSAQEIGI